MTRSSRRLSSGATPGAVVCANHCCGTTRPSAATASRATRTHARSRMGARLASSPLRAQAARWSPNWSTSRSGASWSSRGPSSPPACPYEREEYRPCGAVAKKKCAISVAVVLYVNMTLERITISYKVVPGCWDDVITVTHTNAMLLLMQILHVT